MDFPCCHSDQLGTLIILFKSTLGGACQTAFDLILILFVLACVVGCVVSKALNIACMLCCPSRDSVHSRNVTSCIYLELNDTIMNGKHVPIIYGLGL